MPVTVVKTWVEKNLWAILAAGTTLWSGYLTGQVTTKAQIADLDRRLARAEQQMQGRRAIMVCAVRALDRINYKVQATLPCNLDVPE